MNELVRGHFLPHFSEIVALWLFDEGELLEPYGIRPGELEADYRAAVLGGSAYMVLPKLPEELLFVDAPYPEPGAQYIRIERLTYGARLGRDVVAVRVWVGWRDGVLYMDQPGYLNMRDALELIELTGAQRG